MMKVGMLRWGFILGYLCGPDVVTRVFIGKEGGRRLERDKDGVSSGGDGEREGEKDAGCWPCRWRTAPPAEECGRPLETGKGEETASPLEPPKEHSSADASVSGLLTSRTVR